MPDVKISALPEATSISSTDVAPVVTGGITKKASAATIVKAVLPAPGAIGSTTPDTGAFTTLTATNAAGVQNVSSANTNYTASGTGAVQRTVAAKLQESVSVKDFGAVGDGVTDDTTAIQNGIDYLNSINGGSLYFPIGTYVTSKLTVYSNIWLIGAGASSVIYLKSGSNSDLIYGYNSDALWGTNTTTGVVSKFGLLDITLDGNRSGNTTGTGSVVAIYGQALVFNNVYIKNARGYGVRTEYANAGESVFGMESYYSNIKIDSSGMDGWYNNGPHDSTSIGVIIIDSSLNADYTYSGFNIASKMTGLFVGCHAWSRAISYRHQYALKLVSTGCSFSGCQFEGGYDANVYIAGQRNIFDDDCRYYAAKNGFNIILTGTSTENTIRGFLDAKASGAPDCVGITLGTTVSDYIALNTIDVQCHTQEGGNFNFSSYDAGNNTVTALCYNTTSATIIGTPSLTDIVNISIQGYGSGANISQNKNLVILANNSNDALRVTQTGSGNALVVEDSANPDSTPFVVSNSGKVGVGVTPFSDTSGLSIGSSLTGGTVTNQVNIYATVASDVTTTARGYISQLGTAAAAFALNNIHHFNATQLTIGSGSTVANQIGFIANSNLTGATNNYGFYGAIPAAAGRYNLYMAGSADNYLAGALAVGGTGYLSSSLVSAAGSPSLGVDPKLFHAIAEFQTSATSTAASFRSAPSIVNSAFTLPTLYHFAATQGTYGASATLTNQHGFYAGGALTGATNNYGFYGNLPSGTGRYNLYMAGTADNYMAGRLGIGATPSAGQTLVNGAQITGATASYANVTNGSVQSGVTGSAHGYATSISTAASAFTLNNLIHFRAIQSTIGVGSAVNIQQGFYADSSLTGATNNYGFFGNVAAGTGRYNLYMAGTADNWFSGNVLIGGAGSLGYTTGSGGSVTQITSRTTGVTLNKTNGSITLVSAAGLATYQSFTVTNSTVAATDTIIINQKSGTDLYEISITAVAAGSFRVTYRTTGGTTTEQPVFNFSVIKAVAA